MQPLQKQFKHHILTFIPTAKIESVRFRSVAFQNPTSQLPTLYDAAESKGKGKPPPKAQAKDGRPHDRERAATWRATKVDEDEDPAKSYLTPKEKKRIAFIKHELHEKVDAINAYIVFAHPPPAVTRAANLPPPTPTMDPYEAAIVAATEADGSIFMDRTIRVDCVGRQAGGAGDATTAGMSDPKATVFVGNLDFASKEEDLRVFFEGLVSAERGPPSGEDGMSGAEEDEEDSTEDAGDGRTRPGGRGKRPRTWVKRVRIIRDKDTQLGKGFAYVQFTVCVVDCTVPQYESDLLLGPRIRRRGTRARRSTAQICEAQAPRTAMQDSPRWCEGGSQVRQAYTHRPGPYAAISEACGPCAEG